MEYLLNHFTSYAEAYIRVLMELYLLLDAVLLMYWLKAFMKSRRAVCVSAALYYLLRIFVQHVDQGKDMDRLLTVASLVLSILISWLLDQRRNPVQKIFLFFVFKLISWLSIELLSEVGLWERDFFFGFEWYRNSLMATVLDFLIWNILQYALALLLSYAVIRMIHKAYRYKHDELGWQEFVLLLAPAWTLLLVKPIMLSYYMLWMDGLNAGSISENLPASPYRILFCGFAYVSIVAVIILYQRLKEEQEEAFVRDSVEKQIGDIYGHVENIEEIYDRMRGIKHDMANHLTVIKRLAEDGRTDELAVYLEELDGNVEHLRQAVSTGNAVTDVVLSEAAERCGKEKIAFESAFVYPRGLNINPFDMSVILTNALQNAVEASAVVEAPAISIRSVQREQLFIISIRNITRDGIMINGMELPESSKREAGHGYGLKNIRSIAGKYMGDMEIKQEEEDGRLYFVINIMLCGDQLRSAAKKARFA